jgi:hypothetical protein
LRLSFRVQPPFGEGQQAVFFLSDVVADQVPQMRADGRDFGAQGRLGRRRSRGLIE